jgi:Cu/Ag efflux pump CusA
MNRITARASRELRAIPGVRGVGGHLGRAVTGDQIVGASSGELWVNVDTGANYDSTVAAVKRVVAEYPGLTDRVETYSQAQTEAALGGTGSDLVVRVYGEDVHTLARQAGRVQRLMSGIDGVAGAHVLLPREEPTIQVRVDIDRADKYGLKPGDVRRSATTLLSGLVVGSLFEQEKVFDVVVWGTPQIRNSLTSVRNLLIDTPTGGQVRLGDVAGVRIAASPNVIRRQAVSRYVDVAANVSGRDRGAVAGDVRTALQNTRFPIEYHAQVLAADKRPAWRLVTIAAVAGMLLLLQAFFGSWRLAILSLLTMPVGVAGGLLAAFAVGDKLSFGSYIALFAILGLSIRGGVLLFDRYRELEQEDGEPFGAQLVVRGARERLAPVLLTGVAVACVFLPVLIMGTRPGLELLHPLAVVTVGGLVTSVPFTLFVLPVLYLRFGMSRAHAPSPAEQLTGVLDELAQGAAAATYASDVPSGGIVATESRALPPQGGD